MGGNISLASAEGKGSIFTVILPFKHTKSRAPSTSSSEVYGSRPGSISNASPPENNRVSTGKMPGDPKGEFEKDTQPRLVGLSQPFFAAAPSPSARNSTEQLAALDSVAVGKETKLRVLGEHVFSMLNLVGCMRHFIQGMAHSA